MQAVGPGDVDGVDACVTQQGVAAAVMFFNAAARCKRTRSVGLATGHRSDFDQTAQRGFASLRERAHSAVMPSSISA